MESIILEDRHTFRSFFLNHFGINIGRKLKVLKQFIPTNYSKSNENERLLTGLLLSIKKNKVYLLISFKESRMLTTILSTRDILISL